MLEIDFPCLTADMHPPSGNIFSVSESVYDNKELKVTKTLGGQLSIILFLCQIAFQNLKSH